MLSPVTDPRAGYIERRECPEHFQERIALAGGMNRYDEPMFRIAWAQTETVMQGGEWESEGEWFKGYQPVYLSDGLPHWVLLRWVDAGKSLEPFIPAETPTQFYENNRCPKTGLQLLGEYPYHGSYKVALPLVAKWFENGQLKIHAYPLDTEIIDMMIPMIQAAMILPIEAKMRFMRDENEKQEEAEAHRFEDAYLDVKLSPSARASQWIADKERQIEKAWNAAMMTRMFSRNRRFQRTSPIARA